MLAQAGPPEPEETQRGTAAGAASACAAEGAADEQLAGSKSVCPVWCDDSAEPAAKRQCIESAGVPADGVAAPLHTAPCASPAPHQAATAAAQLLHEQDPACNVARTASDQAPVVCSMAPAEGQHAASSSKSGEAARASSHPEVSREHLNVSIEQTAAAPAARPCMAAAQLCSKRAGKVADSAAHATPACLNASSVQPAAQ
jgi:hypothetical protein